MLSIARALCLIAASIILFTGSSANALMMSDLYDMNEWDASFARNNGVEYFKTCETGSANTVTQSTSQSGSKGSPGAANAGSRPATGGGCGSTTDAQANKQQIWSFLKGKGLTDEAAAGIMGNMEQESGFMPNADNGKTMGFQDSTGKGCRGIVQWCHSRNSGLDSFAAERGTSWDCLGTQLDYMWYEMTETDQGQYDSNGNKLEISLVDALNGKDFSAKGDYTGSGAANAGAIFHDYFERANKNSGEHLGRGERAEGIYEEMTGKPVDPLPQGGSSSPSGSSNNQGCKDPDSSNDKTTQQSSGQGSSPIPSADCAENVQKIKDLTASGKIKQDSGRQNNDLKNCTTDQVPCGTSNGSVNSGGGGINPNILRATNAVAENTGDGTLVLWSFNSGHDCDGLNHPNGKAVDIPCGDSGQGDYTDMEKCKRIADYIIENKEELGVTELLWQQSYRCDDGVNCTIDGHGDHIHIGVAG